MVRSQMAHGAKWNEMYVSFNQLIPQDRGPPNMEHMFEV